MHILQVTGKAIHLIRLICGVALMMPALLQAQSIALMNGNLLDVEGRSVRPGVSVLIHDGRIAQVGPGETLDIPADVQRVDCSGKWIMPGLVDAHIHLFQSGGLYTRPDVIDLRRFRPYEQERAWLRENAGDLLARYLAAGITTVIDMGGPMANYAIRDRFNGETTSPTILLTGPLISTLQPEAFRIEDAPIIQVDTPEAARERVRAQLPYKPDLIKIWYIVRQQSPAASTLPIVQATIEEAHAHGLKVAVHATQLRTAKLAVKAGADILVHSVADAAVDDEFIALLKQRQVPYIPTLIVGRRYGEALSLCFVPSAHDFALANPVALGSLRDLKHLAARGAPVRTPAAPFKIPVQFDNLRKLAEAGVIVATGTDAGNIGTPHASAYLDEVIAMEKAGLLPWDIIVASTVNGARVLNRQDRTGVLRPGMEADVLVLDRDPVADIRNLQAVHGVVKHGVWLEPQALLDASPATLAQQQLNGYNLGDIEAFLAPYADDVKVYGFPGNLRYTGKEIMRERYAALFERTPELHCELVNRMVMGNTVIDQESVTGRGDTPVQAIAIYKIVAGKIAEVYFVSGR